MSSDEVNVDFSSVLYAHMIPSPRLTVGAKRNLANAIADGDVIVHWDDDDWSHPLRLQHQVQFLEKTGKPVTGYHEILYWDTVNHNGYKYIDPVFRPHAAGTSLCYTRGAWLFNKFADRDIGEDYLFVQDARRRNALASQAGEKMLVARIHPGNTCHPEFGSGKFPHVATDKFPEEFLAVEGYDANTI